jgi:hypothetical protein
LAVGELKRLVKFIKVKELVEDDAGGETVTDDNVPSLHF